MAEFWLGIRDGRTDNSPGVRESEEFQKSHQKLQVAYTKKRASEKVRTYAEKHGGNRHEHVVPGPGSRALSNLGKSVRG